MRAFVVTSYSYVRDVTPADTPDADSTIAGARYLQNLGDPGIITVTQAVTYDNHPGIAPTALTTGRCYLATGESIEVGASWRNVNSTDTAAGVDLVAFF